MKYLNKKVVVDGINFDSKKESVRWLELKMLERSGHICNLERQVVFRLDVNGFHICKYIADFVYFRGSKRVVEDSKSAYTKKLPVYRIKKKLMKSIYNIEIIEV